jgi:hypothetical protein
MAIFTFFDFNALLLTRSPRVGFICAVQEAHVYKQRWSIVKENVKDP